MMIMALLLLYPQKKKAAAPGAAAPGAAASEVAMSGGAASDVQALLKVQPVARNPTTCRRGPESSAAWEPIL